MNKIYRRIFETFLVLFGNFLYAFGIGMFILPGGLITGGTTGIALFMNQVAGIPVSAFVFGVNSLLFLLGFAVFGRKFAANTLISTISYPIVLEIVQRIADVGILTDDLFLCTVFGGICIGAAMGIVIRAGASSGGMDIPPLVLNHYFKIPVSRSIYVFDMLKATRSTGEQILYGILLVIIYSTVIDKCLMMGTAKMQLKVVSDKIEEIRSAIITDIDRGVTMLKSETGYMGQHTQMLLTVVSMRELTKTEKVIHEVDENAFVIINRVSEVSGRGFSSKKRYLEKEEQE